MLNFTLSFTLVFKILFSSLFLSYVYSHSTNKELSKVLLISLDGFRHDYFELALKSGVDLKFFKRIFKLGIKADHMNNVFVTKTFPNHMSIITGCFEETHGIIDNYFYDPIFNETFSYVNPSQSVQSKWFSNSEPMWVTNIHNGHKSAIVYWPGQLAAYQDKLIPTFSFGAYNQFVTLDYKFRLVLQWLSFPDTTLGILYHPEPDMTGHSYGPNSRHIIDKIKEIDTSLGNLLYQIDNDKALKNKLNVIIISDHGMTAISNKRRIIMDKHIDPKLYNQYHEESYSIWGLWPYRTSNISEMMSKLKEIDHVTVYEKADIPREWHYANNRRVAPIIVLAEHGWSLVHKSTDFIHGNGSHGYSTDHMDMKGIFVAWGPDILPTNRSEKAVRAVDVFPLIAEILKWTNIPSINGSLTNVQWIIKTHLDESRIFTSLVILCVLSLVTVLSACIVISCAHYNANALRMQKMGNTYFLKSGNLVRKWKEKQGLNGDKKGQSSFKYKQYLKKSKITETDAEFLMESNDEDEILGDIPSSNFKFNS